jgi:hypothetical protein
MMEFFYLLKCSKQQYSWLNNAAFMPLMLHISRKAVYFWNTRRLLRNFKQRLCGISINKLQIHKFNRKNILLQERDFRPLSSTHVLILEIIERKKKQQGILIQCQINRTAVYMFCGRHFFVSCICMVKASKKVIIMFSKNNENMSWTSVFCGTILWFA